MTKRQKIVCNAIIHTASAAATAVGAGLAQIPLSDSAVIVPIQTTMVIGLASVFGHDITKGAAEAAAASASATLVGRMIPQLIIDPIPIIGNSVNAATAAAVTEAVGWLVAKDFERDSLLIRKGDI